MYYFIVEQKPTPPLSHTAGLKMEIQSPVIPIPMETILWTVWMHRADWQWGELTRTVLADIAVLEETVWELEKENLFSSL